MQVENGSGQNRGKHERMFEDMASGAKADRTGLTALMTVLRAGDPVIIWRLDRLGRSLKNLIELVERLESAKVGLRSLRRAVYVAYLTKGARNRGSERARC